jgi:hypothetical protein
MTEEQKMQKVLLEKNIEGIKTQAATLRFQLSVAENTLAFMAAELEKLNGQS